jgi:hypothetical protein
MHAVLVRVTIKDPEAAPKLLTDRVVPNVSQSPGFVAGYWMRPQDTMGYSLVAFESEETARAAADQVVSPDEDAVTIDHVDVQEIIASA